MQDLIARVLAKDFGAINAAKEGGAPAIASLLGLVDHSDAQVRELALLSLGAIGGRAVQPALVSAVLDPDPLVRAAAMRGLSHHGGAHLVPALLDAYDRSPEPSVRRELALMLGRNDGFDVQELRSRCDTETAPEARETCIVALARLGEPEARRKFVADLHASGPRTRPRFLEYCEYIHAPWLLHALLPILEDETPAKRVGIDGLPGPEYLRACDVAVNLVASIANPTFSFAVGPRAVYDDSAIEEVRRFILDQP